jgi:hypothetical protein
LPVQLISAFNVVELMLPLALQRVVRTLPLQLDGDQHVLLGRVNTTECFNDQSEVDEGNKHHIKFLEAREDTPEPLQPSEQSLNLVTADT